MTRDPGALLQIGYFSSATGEQDATTVHKILVAARRDNQRASVTGLLVASGGRYLQVIEGPHEAVEQLYGRILKDERHLAVTLFNKQEITERTFGSWSMAYRRPTNGSQDFMEVLQALTTEIANTQLKRQIRFFASAVMARGNPTRG